MSGRALFLTIWTPLMALTVWGLFFKKSYLDQSGKPLAQVESQVGDIQYRTEDEILWRLTEDNQYVFENDNIATGDNSYASLNFGNSRIIELGPNTQIRIRPLGSEGSEFELDLLHGNIAARDRDTGANGALKSGSGKLKVRAGNQLYTMADKAELGLVRARASSESALLHAGGSVKLSAGVGTETSVQSKADAAAMALISGVETELQITPPTPAPEVKKPRVLAARPIPPPQITTPPPQAPVSATVAAMPQLSLAELNARSLLPTLLYPPADGTLWIADTFENAAKKVIPVALAPPADVGSDPWQPILGAFASTDDERPKLLWEGSAAARRQVIPINLAQLQEKGVLKTESGEPPERQFILAPGVKAKAGDKTVPYFGERRTIVARSIAMKLQGPVKIELGRMDFKEMRQPWFFTPQNFESTTTIFFKEAIDLAKLAPILHVSRGFRWLAQDDSLEGPGVYILRKNKVVGKLSGAIGNQRALEAVRVGIDADVIYRGTARAYIGGLAEFKERALKKQLPEKVYIVNNGRFIAVNRDFMNTNPALRRFLDENSPAFFADPIETLAANNFLQ